MLDHLPSSLSLDATSDPASSPIPNNILDAEYYINSEDDSQDDDGDDEEDDEHDFEAQDQNKHQHHHPPSSPPPALFTPGARQYKTQKSYHLRSIYAILALLLVIISVTVIREAFDYFTPLPDSSPLEPTPDLVDDLLAELTTHPNLHNIMSSNDYAESPPPHSQFDQPPTQQHFRADNVTIECANIDKQPNKCAFVKANCPGDSIIPYLQLRYCAFGENKVVASICAVLLLAFLLFLFLQLLGETVDTWLIPSLTTFSDQLKLSQIVTGLIFISSANGSGDVLVSISVLRKGAKTGDIGLVLGALSGAALAIAVLALGVAIIAANNKSRIARGSFFRSMGGYAVVLITGIALCSKGSLRWYDGIILVVLWCVFVSVTATYLQRQEIKKNKKKKIKRKIHFMRETSSFQLTLARHTVVSPEARNNLLADIDRGVNAESDDSNSSSSDDDNQGRVHDSLDDLTGAGGSSRTRGNSLSNMLGFGGSASPKDKPIQMTAPKKLNLKLPRQQSRRGDLSSPVAGYAPPSLSLNTVQEDEVAREEGGDALAPLPSSTKASPSGFFKPTTTNNNNNNLSITIPPSPTHHGSISTGGTANPPLGSLTPRSSRLSRGFDHQSSISNLLLLTGGHRLDDSEKSLDALASPTHKSRVGYADEEDEAGGDDDDGDDEDQHTFMHGIHFPSSWKDPEINKITRTYEQIMFILFYPMSILRWLTIPATHHRPDSLRGLKRMALHVSPFFSAIIFAISFFGENPFEAKAYWLGAIITGVVLVVSLNAVYFLKIKNDVEVYNRTRADVKAHVASRKEHTDLDDYELAAISEMVVKWELDQTNDELAKPLSMKIYEIIFAFLAFISSIAWLGIFAGEIVDILQTIGTMFGVSESLLGLSVLALSNSVPDILSNRALAVNGRKMAMAYSALLSAPILSSGLGFGLAVFLATLTETPVIKFSVTPLIIICWSFVVAGIVVNFIGFPLQKFTPKPLFGYGLAGLYGVFIVCAVIAEFVF